MTDPTPIQSDAADARPADSPDRPGQVIDVPFQHDLTSMGLLIGLIILCSITAIISVAVILNSGLPGPLKPIVLFFALLAQGCGVAAIIMGSDKCKRRRVHEKLRTSAELPLKQRLEQILDDARTMGPKKTMKAVVEQFAQERLQGVAVRIGPPDKLAPLEPIPFRFEPRRFYDLAELDGMTPEELDADADLPTPAASPRGVRRNMMLKGGWVLLGIFLLNWAARVVQSLAERRFRPELIFWTLALLAFALIPAEQSWFSNRQFLALPGGLLMRKSDWFKKSWRLKVFRRAASFVMLYPLWKKQWILIVSDGEECESVMGLKSELELALRAWLAPYEPPAVEQLSDLT